LGSILQRLESLHLPEIVEWQGLELQPMVMRVVKRNRDSLRKLSLHFGIWDSFHSVKLSRLNSLSARVGSDNVQQDYLENFLVENQDTLLEIDIRVDNGLKKGLFDVIRHRSPYLTKFHLEAERFFDARGKKTKVDWTFLSQLKRLKNFQLSRNYSYRPKRSTYASGLEILESLPRTQLERLSLRGLATRLDAWNSREKITVIQK